MSEGDHLTTSGIGTRVARMLVVMIVMVCWKRRAPAHGRQHPAAETLAASRTYGQTSASRRYSAPIGCALRLTTGAGHASLGAGASH